MIKIEGMKILKREKEKNEKKLQEMKLVEKELKIEYEKEEGSTKEEVMHNKRKGFPCQANCIDKSRAAEISEG